MSDAGQDFVLEIPEDFRKVLALDGMALASESPISPGFTWDRTG